MPFAPSPPALFPTYLLPSLPFRQRRQSSVSSTSSTSSSSSPPSSPDTTVSEALPIPYLTGHSSHLRCNRCLADLALSTQIISKGFTGRHGRAYLVDPDPAHALSRSSPTFLSSSSSSSPSSSSSSSSSSSPSSRRWSNNLLVHDDDNNDPHPAQPNLPNTFLHKPVPRQLVTGAHTVADIACAQCGSVLGWKYVAAAEAAQRYKVGKVILETKRVCRSSAWEGGRMGTMREEGGGGGGGGESGGAVMHGDDEHGVKGMLARGSGDPVEFDSQDEDECEDLFMGVWTAKGAAKRRRMKGFGKGSGED